MLIFCLLGGGNGNGEMRDFIEGGESVFCGLVSKRGIIECCKKLFSCGIETD